MIRTRHFFPLFLVSGVFVVTAYGCSSDPAECVCQYPATGTGGTSTSTGAGTGGTTTADAAASTGGDTTTGGTGGTTTAGGTGGTGGEAAGGTGGTGGSGGSGGGVMETCTGCARLSGPLTMPNDQTYFIIPFDPVVDMSASMVTFRVRVVEGTAGGMQTIAQNGEENDYLGVYEWNNLSDHTGDLHDVVLDLSAYAGSGAGGAGGAGEPAFDPSQVSSIGLSINAGEEGPWTSPTIIYVDSITISDAAAGPWDFAASVDPMVVNSSVMVAGATLTHIPDVAAAR
jgi:hypothetical protein